MLSFAWRNLMTRPLRTILGLIGLSIPILGVIGLLCISGGLRNLVGDTLSQIQGVMVLRENVPSPVFSDLPSSLAGKIRKIPGVRIVAPEVWKIAPTIEDVSLITRTMSTLGIAKKQKQLSLLDTIVIQGQDIPTHLRLKSPVYSRKMLAPEQGGGRYLTVEDQGKPHIIISKKIANDFRRPDGSPRRVGDSLAIYGKPFEIVGIYDTGSMFLDVVIVMDIGSARKLLNISEQMTSSFYVEPEKPELVDKIAERIEKLDDLVDARSMNEFETNFSRIMGQFDKMLLMIVNLALGVGVVGIVNTMLMSTTERFVEFGVLRTNGWSRRDVLFLVTAESAYLGLLAGIVGCALAVVGTKIANLFITGGLTLDVTGGQIALGIGLALSMGTLGGLYPAWRASRLAPMDAIRLGSH
jgi:putative ABC transport system permease protein